MKNIRVLSENFQFLEVKFSIYLYRRVFVMLAVYNKELNEDLIANAKAGLTLRQAHLSEGTFSDVAALNVMKQYIRQRAVSLLSDE